MNSGVLTCVRNRSACTANAGSVEMYWITSSMDQSTAAPFGSCGITVAACGETVAVVGAFTAAVAVADGAAVAAVVEGSEAPVERAL